MRSRCTSLISVAPLSLGPCCPGPCLGAVIFTTGSSRAWLRGPAPWLVSPVSPQKPLSLGMCLCSSRVKLQGAEQGWGHGGSSCPWHPAPAWAQPRSSLQTPAGSLTLQGSPSSCPSPAPTSPVTEEELDAGQGHDEQHGEAQQVQLGAPLAGHGCRAATETPSAGHPTDPREAQRKGTRRDPSRHPAPLQGRAQRPPVPPLPHVPRGWCWDLPLPPGAPSLGAPASPPRAAGWGLLTGQPYEVASRGGHGTCGGQKRWAAGGGHRARPGRGLQHGHGGPRHQVAPGSRQRRTQLLIAAPGGAAVPSPAPSAPLGPGGSPETLALRRPPLGAESLALPAPRPRCSHPAWGGAGRARRPPAQPGTDGPAPRPAPLPARQPRLFNGEAASRGSPPRARARCRSLPGGSRSAVPAAPRERAPLTWHRRDPRARPGAGAVCGAAPLSPRSPRPPSPAPGAGTSPPQRRS